MAYLLAIGILIAYLKLSKKIDDLKSFTDKRIHESDLWLFNSLYSINPNVVLPDDVEKKLSDIPTTVVHLDSDGMDEFNGQRDDWY